MQQHDVWVDGNRHLLHIHGRIFPCDRDIEALKVLQDHVLLLSSDTDCLSLWDREGLICTARVGVYPQDMDVTGSTVYVCGGADSTLYELSLPDLHIVKEMNLPGMPERITLYARNAFVLSLLTDPDIHTLLLQVNLDTGEAQRIGCYSGLPGAITTDSSGLWLGLSEMTMHLPFHSGTPDLIVEGIEFPRKIESITDGILITDGLAERQYFIRTQKERPPCDERPCV